MSKRAQAQNSIIVRQRMQEQAKFDEAQVAAVARARINEQKIKNMMQRVVEQDRIIQGLQKPQPATASPQANSVIGHTQAVMPVSNGSSAMTTSAVNYQGLLPSQVMYVPTIPNANRATRQPKARYPEKAPHPIPVRAPGTHPRDEYVFDFGIFKHWYFTEAPEYYISSIGGMKSVVGTGNHPGLYDAFRRYRPDLLYDRQPSATQAHQPVPTQVHQPVPTQAHQPVPTQVHQPVPTQVHQPVSSQVYQYYPVQASQEPAVSGATVNLPNTSNTPASDTKTTDEAAQPNTTPHITMAMLDRAGWTVSKLLSKGVTLRKMLRMGLTVSDLLKSNVTLSDMVDADVNFDDIMAAGISFETIVHCKDHLCPDDSDSSCASSSASTSPSSSGPAFSTPPYGHTSTIPSSPSSAPDSSPLTRKKAPLDIPLYYATHGLGRHRPKSVPPKIKIEKDDSTSAKKTRGRPKGSKNKGKGKAPVSTVEAVPETPTNPEKRKRGRPCKNPLPEVAESSSKRQKTIVDFMKNTPETRRIPAALCVVDQPVVWDGETWIAYIDLTSPKK
ncbi:uncharacterized protein J4E87_004353 [Alternaria ethzedia]|uniref:uncharacterized protein n=1 Tax=Alternaria ethzedia TaxID=181014 RepID=UPI0020C1BF28|nr:uncharacterized protein J4E87_004353 [Alternaria ethzedia]KAI4627011.1 hypothetical protein J4E87_004353 [Alternaria ethzedia]